MLVIRARPSLILDRLIPRKLRWLRHFRDVVNRLTNYRSYRFRISVPLLNAEHGKCQLLMILCKLSQLIIIVCSFVLRPVKTCDDVFPCDDVTRFRVPSSRLGQSNSAQSRLAGQASFLHASVPLKRTTYRIKMAQYQSVLLASS